MSPFRHRFQRFSLHAAVVCGLAGLTGAHVAMAADASASAAQPGTAASAPEPIHYPSVAAARAALEAQDGISTVVTHSEEWTVVNEPSAAAQWSFTAPGHAAHPAVVRRIIRRGPNGAIAVETTSLCEGPAAACTALLREFEPLNERIVQSLRARSGRSQTTP